MDSQVEHGSVVAFPWPCSGCGHGHGLLWTYEWLKARYVCGCGEVLDEERVAEVRARWDARET